VTTIVFSLEFASEFDDVSANTVEDSPIAIATAPTSAVGLKITDMICSIHPLPVND
jgi:hypothetical protein